MFSNLSNNPDLPRWIILLIICLSLITLSVVYTLKPLDADITSSAPTEQRTVLHIFSSQSEELSDYLSDQLRTDPALSDTSIRWHQLSLLRENPPANTIILDTNKQTVTDLDVTPLAPVTLLDNCQSYLFAGVNFRNTLVNISPEQLQAILRGEIVNWSELQATEGEIQILLPSDQIDGTYFPSDRVLRNILKGDPVSTSARYYDSLKDALTTLAKEPSMLALIPAAAFDQGSQIRHLNIAGIAPLKQQGDRSLYPLKYSLFLSYPEQSASSELTDQTIPAILASLEDKKFTNQACFSDTITLNGIGDVMLSRHVGVKIREANDNSLPFRQTAAFLAQSDITFGNLESPFYDQGPPITEGMVFKAEPETVQGLLLAGIDIVDLANNHFGNQGRSGMLYTFDHLQQNNVEYFGAGKSYTEAHEVKLQLVGDYRIGFLGYNEIPPASYAADDSQAGVAWEDTAAVEADIADALEQTDFLIVSFHWGAEYTPYPSINQQRFAHIAIDAGADMIISHHPHVVQAVEFYEDKFIAYSLGNFVFDQMWSLETQQGLIANIVLKPLPSLEDDLVYELKPISIDLIPVRIHDYNQPSFADTAESTQILQRVFTASDNLR